MPLCEDADKARAPQADGLRVEPVDMEPEAGGSVDRLQHLLAAQVWTVGGSVVSAPERSHAVGGGRPVTLGTLHLPFTVPSMDKCTPLLRTKC